MSSAQFMRRCGVLLVLLGAVSSAAAQGAKLRSDRDAGTALRRSDTDDPQRRQEWFQRGRTMLGESAAALRLRAYHQKLALRKAAQDARRAAAARTAGQATQAAAATQQQPLVFSVEWKNLGPAPLISDPTGAQDYGFVSGRLTSVVVDQNDPTGNTVYVGAAYGGLWRSTNAAAFPSSAVVWTPLTDDQASLAIGAVAVQPGNPNLVLAGTGEPTFSGLSYYGAGILRSSDAGASWTLVSNADAGVRDFKGLAFSHILFSPDNPNLVVAGASSSPVASQVGLTDTTGLNVYFSLDAGQSWTSATITDAGVPISPASVTGIVYNAALHAFFAAVRHHGYYISSDGMNWSRLPSQPSGALSTASCPASTSFGCPIGRGELTVVPNSATMYTWFVDDFGTSQGIFRTLDGGNTWTALGMAGITTCGDNFGCGTGGQGDYDLAIAAVPDGANVDLYAGAVNLFKCSVTSFNPTCSNTGSWLNLTHVYGCTPEAALAHVHPDQHAIDFSLGNPNVVYFANDGGIYRTLHGPLLDSGACTAHLPFDNLNGTIGSLTQFIAVSTHPTDVSAVLGGTQDNGSPAVDSADDGINGTTWKAVNAGDGGYNAIDPLNGDDWFTANTDVSIQRCQQGINCTAAAFADVIANASASSTPNFPDSGLFYTPYMLDPRAPSRIIIGTCRVWRGNSSGAGFTSTSTANALSFNFDTSTAATCTGNENHMVSALAAAGPATANGSQVVYAGTIDGFIFSTIAADSGPPSWRRVMISPSGFKVSSIATDPSDPTGQTAYATVMGFGGPHVLKTTTAFQNGFTDVSSNLPDAPADSVVLDPGNPSFVYVGTDVGVFVTLDGVIWSEYGVLPNVPVLSMRAFAPPNSDVRKLVIGTHGRGVWQADMASGLPFRISLSPASLTAFPGQTATFAVTLTPQSGFTGTVAVSCTGDVLPATCTGGVADLSGGPAQLLVSVANPAVGTFSFTIKAVGSDAAATTFEMPVTLSVGDFDLSLSPGTPSQFTIGHSSSASVNLSLSSVGPFSGTVSLACPNAPAGITCAFPGAPNGVLLVPGATAQTTATISVAGTVPVGSYDISLGATSSGGDHSMNITVRVVLNPVFLMTPGPNVSVISTTIGHQTITLTSQDGYSGTVNLTAQGGATVTPSTVSSSAFPALVDVAFPTVLGMSGPFAMVVNGVDASNAAITNSAAAPFTVMDYTASAPTGLTSFVFFFPGQSGAFSFNFGLAGNSGYTGQVALSCSSTSDPAATCSFTPPGPIAVGAPATPVTTNVTMPAIATPGMYSLSVSTDDVAHPALRELTGLNFAVEDFRLDPLSPQSLTVAPGSSVATAFVVHNTATGASFDGAVTFDPSTACSGLPALATCTFSPPTATSASPVVYVTIHTTAPRARLLPPGSQGANALYAMWMSFPALLGAVLLPDSRRRRRWLIFVAALALVLVLPSCGGGASSPGFAPTPSIATAGTPPGTYNVTVTGTCTNAGMTVSHAMQFTLVVQ